MTSHGNGYFLDEQLMPYLELAGFDVTLEDVVLQHGLLINGSAVTGVSAIAEPVILCYSLLGVSPADVESKFTDLGFSWLKANFEHLSINATKHEVMCTARAYIIHIIEGVLMPDANNNKFGCIQYIPDPPMQLGKIHLINKIGKHGNNWRVVHQKYIAVWDNWMARRPQMDISSDLQPSLEYIQWYFSTGKPYLLGSSSSTTFRAYDFSSMFYTPPLATEEDVNRCNHQ
ncbi:hypothetical protein PVK06_001895 [Gossypium arboreum]|uniref:Uncharacterized protein n=1 Tax=Gossypium arboreum TaxID=29729 RepID=A0ABR0R3C6_GOSAR|nr:hypothetical protein PVK06_001895 [Gossypium arboreum]